MLFHTIHAAKNLVIITGQVAVLPGAFPAGQLPKIANHDVVIQVVTVF